MENECKDKYNYCNNSRIHEDFVPTSEVVHGKDYDTLLLNLPGATLLIFYERNCQSI